VIAFAPWAAVKRACGADTGPAWASRLRHP